MADEELCLEQVHVYQMGGYLCTKKKGHDRYGDEDGHYNDEFWKNV
jgi:hypothetical protein